MDQRIRLLAANLTDDQVAQLLGLALDVAMYPPARTNQWATRAYVPWESINALRDLLEAAGIPVRKTKAEIEAKQKAEKKARWAAMGVGNG